MRARKKLTEQERKDLKAAVDAHTDLIKRRDYAAARQQGIKVMMHKFNVSHTTIHKIKGG